jgi:hypothetical protein
VLRLLDVSAALRMPAGAVKNGTLMQNGTTTIEGELVPDGLPAVAQDWVRELFALPGEEVLKRAVALWPQLHLHSWQMAFLIFRVDRERLYQPGYDSTTAWAAACLRKDSGAVSKYRASAAFVLEELDDDERAEAMCTGPVALYDTGLIKLARSDKQEAVRLAKSGKPVNQLREAVRARTTEAEHHDVGELKTFRLVLREDAYRELMGVWNLVRFQCQTPNPSDSEIAQLLAAEYEAGLQIQPETLEHFPLEEIKAGHVKCIETGATNGNMLEGHHVFPKSHQGHDGPQVWLAPLPHKKVTESWEAHWKEHLRTWMKRRDLAWLKEAVERFLAKHYGGKSLEQV